MPATTAGPDRYAATHRLGIRDSDFGDEFSDRTGRKARDPAIADDHCTTHGPHHPTMIDRPRPDVSPLPCTSSLIRACTAPLEVHTSCTVDV
uniref:hypothetical protein n=1 Tax=Streptomyces sp. CA-141956 TaxID=3240051 RepID=UPI003F493C83